MISIGPVEYDLEEAKVVISRKEDFPTQVPNALLLIREPGFRMWLSNRYLTVALHNEHSSLNLVQHHGILTNPGPSIQKRTIIRTRDISAWQSSTWWEFQDEHDLRRILNSMVLMVVSQGLDWFEEQVKDLKRYHEKLERRRQAAKSRRNRME